MFKFIYSKKDEGIYRIRRIFGIKIITKPPELKIICKLQDIENKIYNMENNLFTNSIQKELYKLEVYKLFANNKYKGN
ncbi:hypothetical protein [Brachyspira pilosicoli]|uniref:Uncharacterized protein n=1 Tax=Brachyspira pilosicoli TaxID=52584 RepID=A0AAJ6KCS1_BRAPL|nr:hypothetical protein [Brachyspira pilosicoli]WIH82425.1 hypothetical protein NEI04_05410 [Brachyspira pilosicoli]WIH86913.1 hypothetical protein NEI03_05655 [Brachyspira pilosicoli]WIH91412.1 hypothetical protein NEI02_05440 [Brachyspira pilosicoli]WIH93703.1 hypothetical protein NEI01_05440 [Brachyspira pilosicoli]WIH95991.1 hypothetical protein NEH99_05425 [Brachyspira pilosicoli]